MSWYEGWLLYMKQQNMLGLVETNPAKTVNSYMYIVVKHGFAGVEFRFGLWESKLILKFQLLHISMEKLILISGCYENHCENWFSDSRRISSPGLGLVSILLLFEKEQRIIYFSL